jgi:hypothetical protein
MRSLVKVLEISGVGLGKGRDAGVIRTLLCEPRG